MAFFCVRGGEAAELVGDAVVVIGEPKISASKSWLFCPAAGADGLAADISSPMRSTCAKEWVNIMCRMKGH